MRILLIEPPKSPVTLGGEDLHIFEPLALEYLAAGLADHHDVAILDMRLDPDLDGALASLQPDLVGLTGYTVHVNVVKRLAARIKEWNPGTLTVVGGHHATVMPSDFRSPHIDLVVAGEGVFALQSIVERLERGGGFLGIPGVGTKTGDGGLTVAPPDPVRDLDSCPFPARSLTAPYRSRYYCDWMKPLASMRTSKGCPFRCSFCAEWKTAGGHYLRRSPERVVEELATIDEPCVFFADDESLVDVERMTRLATLIAEAGVHKRYFLYGRSDTIAANRDLLARWREIGLERVFVGLEGFRDEDLRFIRKRSTIEDNERAVRVLQDLGVDIHASLIVRPEFDHDDFAALRQYCRRLGLGYPGFAILTPLPGTDLHDALEDRLLPLDYEYFDFIHTVLPTALPLEEFYREYARLFPRSVSVRKRFALLFKFPWREYPAVIRRSQRFFSRLRTVHLDYAGH